LAPLLLLLLLPLLLSDTTSCSGSAAALAAGLDGGEQLILSCVYLCTEAGRQTANRQADKQAIGM
jgi:hypothetical protein